MDSAFPIDDDHSDTRLACAMRRLATGFRPARTLFTRAGGALAFDALVFVLLALLAAALLAGSADPLGDEALYMLFGLVGFAVFWGSISGPDVPRYAKLQRRWMRHLRSAPPPSAPVLMLRSPVRPALQEPLRPLAAQSAYRPMRHAVSSVSLWRRSSR